MKIKEICKYNNGFRVKTHNRRLDIIDHPKEGVELSFSKLLTKEETETLTEEQQLNTCSSEIARGKIVTTSFRLSEASLDTLLEALLYRKRGGEGMISHKAEAGNEGKN